MTSTARYIRGALLGFTILVVIGVLGIFIFDIGSDLLSKQKTYDIQFVNYGVRNDVDAGFESYLTNKKILYRITYHSANGSPDKLPAIRRLLEKHPGDLIVTWGTTTTLGIFGTVQDPLLTRTPGVFAMVTSPIASNVVNTLSGPGRNLTGSWHVAPVSNQLRSMLAYKQATKIGVLFTPSEQNSLITIKEFTRQAASIGIEVLAIPFDFQDGSPVSGNAVKALAEIKARGCTWLYLPPDSFLGTQARGLVIPEANRLGLLTFASTELMMLSGATAGLIAPYFKLGELTGQKAEQILIDRKSPASIAVSTVERFNHMLNIKAAERFGIDLTNPLFSDIQQVNP